MSRTASECVKKGCQHPDACSQTRCWIIEEMNEQEEPRSLSESEIQANDDYASRVRDSR